jgi:excisionase family DNA binding protein
MNKQKLTLAEIAAIYKVSPKTFARLTRDKGIPHERLRKRYRFSLAVVEAHLAAVEEKVKLPERRVALLRKGGNKYADLLGV